jgi:predicted DNA-binding WGR domain protein
MELALYVVDVRQTDLSKWVSQISVAAQAEGIQVSLSAIAEESASLQERLPVVCDELGTAPEQRVALCGSNAVGLQKFAYNNYRSRAAKGWNVCLFSPDKDAVFLQFDETLLARKVAHFYYQEGTSDKVYHLYLAEGLTLDFYTVISRYGRRGSKLQQKEKAFDYRLADAESEWNRLHHEKIQKGYAVGHPTVTGQLELELPF